jgi:hypothetical protein
MSRGQRVFACLILTACAVASSPRLASAKNSKDVSTTMDILTTTSLGGKALKAGSYKVIADGSTVTMKRGNKVVAEAPAQWKDEDSKSEYSSIVTNAKGITEIHFQGKDRYLQVQE